MNRVWVVLIMVVLAPESFARRSYDWGNVLKLKRGTKILVTFRDDGPLEGRLVSANQSEIRMLTGDTRHGTLLRAFSRPTIASVTHVKGPRLRDPDPWIKRGALLGAATGITVGVVRDSRAGSGRGGYWLIDGLAGAGLGFLGGCAAAAGKAFVALARHDELIYVDKRPVRRFSESGSLRQREGGT